MEMFVLCAIALFILLLELFIMLKFSAIVIFTSLTYYLIYEFIIRGIGLLRRLFGQELEFIKLKYNNTCKKEVLKIKRH
tara:strand:- start:367 stop:603 length:237 start_codon:yes stop_codon:yes gene_type:complete